MSGYITPKPSYTPEGYRRCKACGRLLKKGRHCICKTREQPRRDKPVKVKVDTALAEEYARETAGVKRVHKKPYIIIESRTSKCEICGRMFSHSRANEIRVCPFCQKKRNEGKL